MNLTEEQLLQNWNDLMSVIENNFEGERLAIVGDITLVYKEDGDNDYSMGFVNPKFWRTYK